MDVYSAAVVYPQISADITLDLFHTRIPRVGLSRASLKPQNWFPTEEKDFVDDFVGGGTESCSSEIVPFRTNATGIWSEK